MRVFAYQMLLLILTWWINVHKNLEFLMSHFKYYVINLFLFSILDYIQCPYCQRRFNENAADRHINFCKEQAARISNKGKFSTDTKGKVTSRPQVKCSTYSFLQINEKMTFQVHCFGFMLYRIFKYSFLTCKNLYLTVQGFSKQFECLTENFNMKWTWVSRDLKLYRFKEVFEKKVRK